MKTTSKVFFILVIILIFSSCFSPWDGDTGTFSISIAGSGGGRFVLPEGVEIKDLEHVITLEGPGPEQTVSVTGAQTVQFSVVPGVWKITIEAYKVNQGGDEESRFLVAVGSRTVDIKPGSNGAITIPMGKPPEKTLMEMVLVEGGSFQMGKELGTAGSGNVTPVSNVTVSSFFIGKYEVTQAQWQAVMESLPSNLTSNNYGIGDAFPIYYVNWYDALAFCNKLSIMEGLTPAYRMLNSTNPDDWGDAPGSNNATWDAVEVVGGSTGYRLPTEAQWEYAAKGGNTGETFTYAGSDTIGDVAWYSNNSGRATHAVGTKAPNGLGLYDMSGNVVEWCWDWRGDYISEDKTDPTGLSSGSNRTVRGGSWDHPADRVYSVYRGFYVPPPYRNIDLGFRVVRPAQSSVEPGTGELVFVLIDNNTAYRVWRGTKTGNIEIPATYNGLPVTSIGYHSDTATSGAFKETSAVTGITFETGSKLTTIDRYAFYNCTGLRSIILPNTLTFIGIYAFYGCTSLESITIPASVLEIGEDAFSGCTSLKTVTFAAASQLQSIGLQVFSDCIGLTNITIPESVTSIGGSAFYNCTSLGSITIPENVTSIGGGAFEGCTSLASVKFEGTVNTIENLNSFPGNLVERYFADGGGIGTWTRDVNGGWTRQATGAEGLVFEIIPDGENAGNYRVTDYTGENAEVHIPASYKGMSVTEIGNQAFSGCAQLETVTFAVGSKLTNIDDQAFYNCTSLTSIDIPASVTTIGNAAFSGCISLTNIIIPDSVTSIDKNAFSGTGWLNGKPNGLVYAGKVLYTYKGTTLLNGVLDGIGEDIIAIAGEAFSKKDISASLTGIIIPASVTSIGGSAFSQCANLTAVTFADESKLTTIGDSAFSGCTSLTGITIPASVRSIGNEAFNGCENLETVTFDNNSQLTVIGNNVFSNCYVLANITIPASVRSIGDSAFSLCTSLESITIPANVTSIGVSLFWQCKLTSITIPANVTSIGYDAFNGCTDLIRVTFDGIITEDNFDPSAFGTTEISTTYVGDLRDKYLSGGTGTYTRVENNTEWTKE